MVRASLAVLGVALGCGGKRGEALVAAGLAPTAALAPIAALAREPFRPMSPFAP